MLRNFYDDLYLYETIQNVTHYSDEKILPIFNALLGKTWTIADIERMM